MHNYRIQTLASKCFFVVKTFVAPGYVSVRGNIVVAVKAYRKAYPQPSLNFSAKSNA